MHTGMEQTVAWSTPGLGVGRADEMSDISGHLLRTHTSLSNDRRGNQGLPVSQYREQDQLQSQASSIGRGTPQYDFQPFADLVELSKNGVSTNKSHDNSYQAQTGPALGINPGRPASACDSEVQSLMSAASLNARSLIGSVRDTKRVSHA